MAATTLPLIPSTVVGSHGRAGWWHLGVKAWEAGQMGPADLDEMLDDAADTAIRDMERAGVDVITDGEVRRLDGYVDSYYAVIKGIRPIAVRRKLGPWGYDQQTRYEAVGPDRDAGRRARHRQGVRVPQGPHRRGRSRRPAPDPSRSAHGSTRARSTRTSSRWRSASRRSSTRSSRGWSPPGAEFIQIDEPARGHVSGQEMARLFNLATEGVRARLGLPRLLREPLRPLAVRPDATGPTSRRSSRPGRTSSCWSSPGARWPSST